MGIIAGFMVPHPPIILPEVGRGEEKKIAASEQRLEKKNENSAMIVSFLYSNREIILRLMQVKYR